MRILHFGTLTFDRDKSWGLYAIHVQCAWRLEGPAGIVTGSRDLWSPSGGRRREPPWTFDRDGNLQDEALGDLLCDHPGEAGSLVNRTSLLVVEAATVDAALGFAPSLSGGYRFIVFPDGTKAEAWRLLQPDG
jgi:hypothetical protein